MNLEGVVVLDKPKGLVSMRAVEQVRRITKVRRAGHAGTLDPMATGVLPICLGRATKIASLLLGEDKEYYATARLGVETDTYDLDGQVICENDVPESLTAELIEEHLAALRGTITQRPPAFSAIRVGGERLYDKARRGENVEAPEREVVVHELELLSFSLPDVSLRVRCGKGTYIRSLAADLGKMLGPGACLAELRRTRVGCLSSDRSHTPDGLAELARQGKLETALVSMADALGHLPSVILDHEDLQRVRTGQPVEGETPLPKASWVRLLDDEGRLFALAEPIKGRLQPRKVFE